EIASQHILSVQRRVGRHEIATAIADGLGKAFPYSLRIGAEIAGRPFARYFSTGPGLFDMQVGLPIAAASSGEGDVEAGTLPGGPVAVAMHGGPYDTLSETYTA